MSQGQVQFLGIPVPLEGGVLTHSGARAVSVHHASTDRDGLLASYIAHAEAHGFVANPLQRDVELTRGEVRVRMALFSNLDDGTLDVILQRG